MGRKTTVGVSDPQEPCQGCGIPQGTALTFRKLRSISLNSSMEVPRVGLSKSTTSLLGTESGRLSALRASPMPHLMITSLSLQSPL